MFIVPVVRVHFKQFVWIYLSELKKRETGAPGASDARLAPTEAERKRTRERVRAPYNKKRSQKS